MGRKGGSTAAIVVVLLLAIAMQAMASGQAAATTTPGVKAQPVEISYFHWRNEDKAQWEKIIAAFSKVHPEITVKMEIVPTTDYLKVLSMRVFTGEVGDLFTVNPGAPFYSVVEANACLDLSGRKDLLDLYLDFAKNGKTKVNGKTFGLLYTYNVMALYYNKKIFAENNLKAPLASWQDLETACEALKGKGITPIISGFGDFPAAWTIFALTTNLDPNFHENYRQLCTGEVKLQDIASLVRGIELVRGLKQKGYYEKDMYSTKYDTMISVFAQGKAAMTVCGTWAMANVRSQNPDLDLGLMNMPNVQGPAKASLNLGAIHCINAKSKNIEAAIEFLKFASLPDQATLMANEASQMIAVNGVKYQNKDFAAIQELRNSPGGADTYMYYDFTNMQIYNEFANSYIEAVLKDKEDVVTILRSHQAEIDKILAAAKK